MWVTAEAPAEDEQRQRKRAVSYIDVWWSGCMAAWLCASKMTPSDVVNWQALHGCCVITAFIVSPTHIISISAVTDIVWERKCQPSEPRTV